MILLLMYPKGPKQTEHAVRNPSFMIELLTYEFMKEEEDVTVTVWSL